MARQRQRGIEKLVAVEIGHINRRFINCRFKRHKKTPFESGGHCNGIRAVAALILQK
ncbi:hypothetical protein SFK227_0197 [Shigella flexneri K-227]|uniref:Uncharacterized protein n=1 Tax=Shigella flexneri K-227 TaxID=766147 RepID=F5NPR4_SHIFL|nr:hypothetical protein SFK272_0540 [Shigella flexneri K-272]EGK41075.1 hypothetical protein SFK227_0197 [Shigella flexneri K-227]